MNDVLSWALNLATQKGASYVDARVVDDRSRSLATKNGKVGHASDAESLGIGIRVHRRWRLGICRRRMT